MSFKRPDQFIVSGDGRRGVAFVLYCPIDGCTWEHESLVDGTLHGLEDLALAHLRIDHR